MSVSATSIEPRSESLPPLGAPGLGALAVLVVGTLALGAVYGPAHGALFLIGGAFGISLYHAAFGFTSAWRVFIAEGRGRGLRVQMILLALAVVLFFPFLSSGVLFGTGRRQGMLEALAKSAARNAGGQISRSIMRGVLGGIFKGR